MTRSLIIIALLFATPAYSLSEKECRDFEQMAAEFNKKASDSNGWRVDEATEVVSVTFSCDLAILTFTKRMLIKTSNFRDGWQARKQRQHNQLHCGGLTKKRGITVIDNILEPDFRFSTKLVTRPNDCS